MYNHDDVYYLYLVLLCFLSRVSSGRQRYVVQFGSMVQVSCKKNGIFKYVKIISEKKQVFL